VKAARAAVVMVSVIVFRIEGFPLFVFMFGLFICLSLKWTA
jgi:hypothetical protein